MLRKILKVFLVIVFIGFISAYIRGIHYNSNKLKNDKSVAQENIETEKQNIIDEEIIVHNTVYLNGERYPWP